jgi:hypothetical protein
MRARILAAALCALVAAGAAHRPVGNRVLPIALVLNGTRLAVNPAPIMLQGRLYVPVRRILTMLGLDFDRVNGRIVTHAGSKTIEVAGGTELRNTLYVPLRFFTEALGAQAVFNRQTNSVEIISTLVGSTGNGISNEGGGVAESGTIAAVDLNSSPPTLTLTHNASVRTLQITQDVTVVVQDVNTGTSNAGVLEDLHPGDYAQMQLDRRGVVKHIVDAYGSRTGRVAGIGAGSIVLDDGHVIVPARGTTTTLNGSDVSIDRLAVGDEVMVRYNIDSSEPREIVATRAAAGTPPPAGPVSISSIEFNPAQPLREGEVLHVTMHAAAGAGVAHYDIGPYVRNLGLRETAPGTYTGAWKVPAGVNIADAPLFGHLRKGDTDAPPAESVGTVSVATEPPGIADFAPDNGATVNNPRPAIYATFAAGAVDVNATSSRIIVNGHDVTSAAVRSARFIDYMPGIDYGAGPVRVRVEVSDVAGNRVTKNWTFFIRK